MTAGAGVIPLTQDDALVQKVVDTSTVHAATRPTHAGDDREHGEDVIDGPWMPVVVKRPPTVSVLKPAAVTTGWAHCLCCLRPCHRHVKVHPEVQVRWPSKTCCEKETT